MATWPAAAADLSCAPLPRLVAGRCRSTTSRSTRRATRCSRPRAPTSSSATGTARRYLRPAHVPGRSPLNAAVAINAAGMAVVVFGTRGTGCGPRRGRRRPTGRGRRERDRRRPCRLRSSAHGRDRRRGQRLRGLHLRQRGRHGGAHRAAPGPAAAGRSRPISATAPPRLHRQPGADRGQPSGGGSARLEAGGRRRLRTPISRRATGRPGRASGARSRPSTTPAPTRPVARSPTAAAGAAWERATNSGKSGQARMREPGARRAVGRHPQPQLAAHANFSQPSISATGRGDFLAASAPNDGTNQPALCSVYDTAAPIIAPIAVAGTLLAGDPVTLTATATEEWSGVGAPAWTFGDGGAARARAWPTSTPRPGRIRRTSPSRTARPTLRARTSS